MTRTGRCQDCGRCLAGPRFAAHLLCHCEMAAAAAEVAAEQQQQQVADALQALLEANGGDEVETEPEPEEED